MISARAMRQRAGRPTLALAVLLAGCSPGGTPGPTLTPPTVSGASVTTPSGTLAINQAALVTVTATAVDADGTVQSVTANLAPIAGPAAQPLAFDASTGVWAATLTLVPTVAGQRAVTITAVDSDNLRGQRTVTVNVAGSGRNLPPQLSDAAVTSPLTANISLLVTASVTAVDPDGTIQAVTADLSQIGGSTAQALSPAAANPNQWTFSGLTMPVGAGTRTVTFTAQDNLGATATTTTDVTVNPTP